jgi:hypothetical protein
MFDRSPKTILAISAAAALTIAALAPTAALAKGPGSGPAGCDGDCTADEPQVQQQVRARNGSGRQAETKANAGGGGQVQAQVGSGRGQNRQASVADDRGPRAQAKQGVGRGQGAGNGNQGAGNGNQGAGNGNQGAGKGPNEDGERGPGSCNDCDAEMGVLTDEQAAGLIFMANEEKLAHDVYAAFAEMYGVRIFENIANSEARHQEAVSVVLERYGLEDTAIELPAGEFSDPIIASLYETLIEQGSAGLDEAIAVGLLIEQTDIADLESRMTVLEETAPDVHEMYSHLLAASGNHLRAFERWQA